MNWSCRHILKIRLEEFIAEEKVAFLVFVLEFLYLFACIFLQRTQ